MSSIGVRERIRRLYDRLDRTERLVEEWFLRIEERLVSIEAKLSPNDPSIPSFSPPDRGGGVTTKVAHGHAHRDTGGGNSRIAAAGVRFPPLSGSKWSRSKGAP